MGGAIGLHLAGSEKIFNSIITINSPVFLDFKSILLIRFSHLFNLNISMKKPSDSSYLEKWTGYTNDIPSSAFREMLKVLKAGYRSLGSINIPVLIIQSNGDRRIPPENAEFILNRIASRTKKIKYINCRSHNIIVNRDFKNEVFGECIEFLKII